MSDFDNKLSGALFKNDKGYNEKRPDYKGSYTDGDGIELFKAFLNLLDSLHKHQ